MRFIEILSEVRIITPGKLDTPLQDKETIRVYHGTSERAAKAMMAGFTGDTKADRKYSYERDNNPRGLFVSPDLRTAKRFGNFVIEFHAKVSDLEPPVWPSESGGKFTSQGEEEKYFRDPLKRKQQQDRMRAELAKGDDAISKSDDPYLASLLSDAGEPQALFIGNMDPKTVRAVWVSKKPGTDSRWADYQRLSKNQFMKLYGQSPDKDKLFGPSESPSFDDFALKATREKYKSLAPEKFKEIVFDMQNNELLDFLNMHLWSDSQKAKVMRDIKAQRSS
jgi:hypothetical protein